MSKTAVVTAGTGGIGLETEPGPAATVFAFPARRRACRHTAVYRGTQEVARGAVTTFLDQAHAAGVVRRDLPPPAATSCPFWKAGEPADRQ